MLRAVRLDGASWLLAIGVTTACGGAPAPERTSAPPTTARLGRSTAVNEPPDAGAEAPRDLRARAVERFGEPRESRAVELDGEARVQLVLSRERCHQVAVFFSAPATARLIDDHGHELGRGEGVEVGFEPLCPRWTGSFEVVMEARSPTSGVLLLR
jgi:hypothetical protein